MAGSREYYQILEINEEASVAEIKQAFRKKAKQLHPDRNQNPEAHQQFILVNEAYDYLLDLKTKPPVIQPTTDPYEEYRRQQAQENYKRAQAYAQMRYEEFLRTDGYKATSSWNVIGEHLYYFSALAVVGILPVLATMLFGWQGLGVSVLLNLLASPLTVYAIRNKPHLSLSAFREAVIYIVKTKNFQLTALTLVDIILFLKIGLQTLIPLEIMALIFILLMLLTFGLCKGVFKLKPVRTYLFSIYLTPFGINLLLLFNFVFSHSPQTETYQFSHVHQTTRQGSQKSTLINLENFKYADYPGIRIFWNYDAMANQDQITYTFRKGLLGIRVMTDFHFSNLE